MEKDSSEKNSSRPGESFVELLALLLIVNSNHEKYTKKSGIEIANIKKKKWLKTDMSRSNL